MYVWKLWRDSRTRFLVCLIAGLLWAGAAVYLKQTLYVRSSVALDALKHNVRIQQAAWTDINVDLFPSLTAMGVLIALCLCETGLARDFALGQGEFVLTRPRRRRYFAWTGWLFGAGQIFLTMALMLLCGFGLLFYLSGVVLNWRALALPILLLPSILLLYGIGYALAVSTNGRNGAITAFGVLLLYFFVVPAFYFYWHVALPRWWFSSLPDWAIRGQGSFPAVALVGWIAFALVFPLLTQWKLERKEV